MDMRSWDVEDWDGFQYPEVSMQFDDKTANLTVDGAFHATPFLRANATEMEPPVRGGPAVIGYMSVRFSGVLDEYHSDTLSLNGSTPSWVRTVGFGNDSSNIGYGESSSARKAVSGPVLTLMAVIISVVITLL